MGSRGRWSETRTLALAVLVAACAQSRSPTPSADPEFAPPANQAGAVSAGGAASAPAASAAGAVGASEAAGSLAVDNPTGNAGQWVAPGPRCKPERTCPQSCAALGFIGERELQRGGCSAGEDCTFAFSLVVPIVLDVGTCDRVWLDLRVTGADGRMRTHSGQLAPSAWDQLLAIALKLAGTLEPSQPTRECLPCQGTDAVIITLGGERFRYPARQPPPELSELDALLQRIADQLLTCGGDMLDGGCQVEQEPGRGSDDACEIVYTPDASVETTCRLEPDADAPCRAALECLCTGTALGRSPEMSVESCVDSWLTPRGAPTFTDFCTPGPTADMGSLRDALDRFAATQRATVTSTALCAELGAWY